MEVTIDKFGRILIPKKVRKALGILPGHVLNLVLNPKNEVISLQPQKNVEPRLTFTEFGFPVFQHEEVPEEFDWDNWLSKERDSRDAKIAGL